MSGVLTPDTLLDLWNACRGCALPPAAALAASVTAVASIAGRLSLGAVIDRLSRRWVTVGLVSLLAVATVFLLFARGDLKLVYVAVLAFGFAMGSVMMLQALLVGDLFGVASFGQIYGASLLVGTAGLAAGPWIAGLLFARFGSYDAAFTGFAAVSLLAAVAIARPPTFEEHRVRELAVRATAGS